MESSLMAGYYASQEPFTAFTPSASQSPSTITGTENHSPLTPGVLEDYHFFRSSPTSQANDGVDGNITSQPYATLIYRALKSVPGHKMVLREIYDWFERHTDKAKDSSSKGWQNSIRHNLSMNGVGKSYYFSGEEKR